MLTAKDQEIDVVKGLHLGADDYVRKPFSVHELLARVEAVLRRAAPSEDVMTRPPFVFQDFVMDFQQRRVTVRGHEIKLGPTEYKLLTQLVRNAGRVMLHADLLRKVWGPEYGGETEYLRVYISYLQQQDRGGPRQPQVHPHRARRWLYVQAAGMTALRFGSKTPGACGSFLFPQDMHAIMARDGAREWQIHMTVSPPSLMSKYVPTRRFSNESMTRTYLQEAFAGESQAHLRYLVYADAAEREGLPNVARFFRAASFSEQMHATAHLRALGGIGTTADNLKTAFGGESFEVAEMYPAYLKVAELQEEKAAQTSMARALEAEKVHARIYAQAQQSVETKTDLALKDVFVCEVCGFTMEGDAPERCPICGAIHTRFKKF